MGPGTAKNEDPSERHPQVPSGSPRWPDDGVLDSAFAALRGVILAAQSIRQSLAGHLEIAIGDTVLLSHLAAAGSLSPRELAQRGGIAPSTTTTVIDRLQRAGLVRRRPRSDDRRSLDIVLTAAGDRAVALSSDRIRAALNDLDRPQLETLAAGLNQLAAALTRHAADFGATVGQAAPNSGRRQS